MAHAFTYSSIGSVTHLFTQSSIPSFSHLHIPPVKYSFTHSPIHSASYSHSVPNTFTQSSICSFCHLISFIHSLACSLRQSLTCLFGLSITQSFLQSFAHSLSHLLVHSVPNPFIQSSTLIHSFVNILSYLLSHLLIHCQLLPHSVLYLHFLSFIHLLILLHSLVYSVTHYSLNLSRIHLNTHSLGHYYTLGTQSLSHFLLIIKPLTPTHSIPHSFNNLLYSLKFHYSLTHSHIYIIH